MVRLRLRILFVIGTYLPRLESLGVTGHVDPVAPYMLSNFILIRDAYNAYAVSHTIGGVDCVGNMR
jgi:hypothetical protein